MAENFWQELLDVGPPKDNNINRWLAERFSSTSANCTAEEFAAFFFATVKTQTDEFIKNNTSTCNTPRKLTSTVDNLSDLNVKPEVIEQKVMVEKPQAYRRNSSRELFGHQDVNFQPFKGQDSPQFVSKKILTPLNSSTPVMTYKKVNLSIDSTPTNTSTPQSTRNNTKNSFDQSSTSFRNSSRNSLDFSSKNNSMNKRNTSSPFCLGDFLNTSSTSSSGKGGKKKNASQQSPLDSTPKFSNTDFPSLEGEVKKADSKPKKRVVPTTISRKNTPGTTTSFISSSFQSENNLLNLSPFETEEIDILSERRMLCDQRDAISKDFSVEKEPQRNLHAIVKESFPVVAQSPSRPRPQFHYDESKVEKIEVLTMMANIYSFLLDMNFVPNILTEFSYLFNLLNTEYDPFEQLQQQSQIHGKSLIESILKNLQNCVFFSACVLSCQKRNLALLDAMTIRVLIENERVQQIAGELFDHLRFVMVQKSQLDASMAKQMSRPGGNISNVVFFQQETDNRDNFPSDREFGAFKKQRDLFYSILRYWELKHLDSAWDFRKELGMKIRSLIILMEHPINMAHLARLFTAQLIISCNFDNSANELQMVLPNIDLSKLSKLRQRLVAPSVFSTQYQFAGNQTFFRDFIVCCDQHMIFMEQLKISLINELLQINDSSMETLCISPVDETLEKSFPEEFVVSAEMMTTMRVLAKFVGFVISRPYSYEGYRNTLVDQKQSQIRNLLHPDFDVKRVVLKAIDGRKLLVTIPWLVEYLAMLDFITIRLDYYRDLFQLLYTIYMRVNVVNQRGTLCVMATSKFIIRACLGWLFEHPEIPEEYYNYNNSKLAIKGDEDEENLVENNLQLNPHLENVLNAACPFLADFRVSMMPQRMTKVVSRTGRYRHITTKFQDKTEQQTKVQDSRERLIEAFLASQTLSVRKVVDFTIDRVTSAVVKDFQVKHLLPRRKDAKAEVEAILTSDVDSLIKKMIGIFNVNLQKLQNQWNDEVKENCKKRIEGAFESLLPIETLDDVKKTLINITFDKTSEKLQEWRTNNIATIEIFSKDIQAEAIKLVENNQQNGNKRTTASIVIELSTVMPSDFFKDLQTLLHKASLYPEKIEIGEIVTCIEKAVEVVDKQILPSNAYRNIAFYTLQLILLVIASRGELITQDLLQSVYALWRHERLSLYTSQQQQQNHGSRQTRIKVDNFVFSKVISARLMVTMQGKPRQTLQTYGDFLVDLVRENFIGCEQINEQSVQLYKHEWSGENLNDIAFLMNHVKSSLSSKTSSSPESHLFMELVADLARDMEDF